jgi:U3 small nucleolar RNA-associated protein 19
MVHSDYPKFYAKFYELFDERILRIKQRAKFFRLASLFLSSAYLPEYLIAAFIKRMARLCLTAPPSGILIAVCGGVSEQ